MTEIRCNQVTCKHNSAFTKNKAFTCKKDKIFIDSVLGCLDENINNAKE